MSATPGESTNKSPEEPKESAVVPQVDREPPAERAGELPVGKVPEPSADVAVEPAVDEAGESPADEVRPGKGLAKAVFWPAASIILVFALFAILFPATADRKSVV